jgi:phage terminase Nu1 subunit (DNA packaging protein)
MQAKNLLTEKDLVEWLSLKNKRQVRALRDRGMPHLKLNGHEIRYDPNIIEQWMAENSKKS